ncbi:MAG: hypothetical protein HC859_08455 [Bacteroidia bacterium]|nr:hypothetical protein [Bacteroidia bacterium]
MKRTAAIMILSILLFNLAGFYCFFAARKYSVRLEMKAALRERSELQSVRLSPGAFERLHIEGDEAKVGNFMFDIAFIEISNGEITLHGLYDHEESTLLALLDDVLGAQSQDDNLPPQVIQFIALVYLVDEHAVVLADNTTAPATTPYRRFSPQVSFCKSTPPPRYVAAS